MLEEFVRFCEVESPSRRERPMADAVAAELRACGLEPIEDDSGSQTGSDAGNVFARVEGPEGARTVLMCAHLDTVPHDVPVEVVCEDGIFQNRNDAILGADNKAAVVVMLALARRLAAEGSPVGVELAFTTCEEISLRGAKAFDRELLRSEYGFVFDHASPIGELVVAAPTYYRVAANFRGKAAHAGIRPEDGRNAIAAAAAAIARLRARPPRRGDHGQRGHDRGRHGAERGGGALRRRARGAQPRPRAGGAGGHRDGRHPHRGRQRRRVRRGDHGPAAVPGLPAAAQLATGGRGAPARSRRWASSRATSPPAARATRTSSRRRASPALNMANGTERNHQPDESVTVDALESMLDVALGLVALSA